MDQLVMLEEGAFNVLPVRSELQYVYTTLLNNFNSILHR